MMGSTSNKTRMIELVTCDLKDFKFLPIREHTNSIRVLGVQLARVESQRRRKTTDAVVAGNAV
jgi:hypothetical protein